MNVIAAVSTDWGIGYKNGLLFHIPQDMKFFKEKTIGKTVIMGRKTLESLPGGNPLKGRTTLVLSTSKKSGEGYEAFSSIKELLDKTESVSPDDIFVCGGQSVYKQLLPYCDTAYITKIQKTASTDKFFPNLDKDPEWELSEESEIFEYNEIKFSFCIYKRLQI